MFGVNQFKIDGGIQKFDVIRKDQTRQDDVRMCQDDKADVRWGIGT